MSLRIRRGTNAQRTGITFDLGEIVYTTDTQKLYIGDGVTAGGKNLLETSAGNGFTFNPTTQQIDFAIGNLNLSTAQVTESSNLYFTTERAQDAVGAALVAGNAFNTGVTFTYDDANNRITAVATGSAGLTTVSSDTNPSLGGNLNTGAFNISGSGSITAGTITATTGLGANLSLNGRTINGTGNINITGSILLKQTDNLQLQNVVGVGGTGYGYLTTTSYRGSFASPTAVQAGDELGGILFRGYTSTTKSAISGIISCIVDPTAVIAGGDYVKSIIVINASTDTTQNEADTVLINSSGVVTSNAFVASKYTQLAVYANDAARTSAIPTPAKGMMVFMTSGTAPTVTNKSVVYDGTAWVALH